jgi:hypothetical protein
VAVLVTPGFVFGVHCDLLVGSYSRALLSVPAISRSQRLDEKPLLPGGVVATDGKATLDEHLAYLRTQGAIREDAPLLALGLRNNLVNLRAPVIVDGQFYAVEGERPAESRRPYYGIGYRNGKLSMGTALRDAEAWPEFFCAGVPVLWDGLDEESLLDLMMIEAADHSHIFNLPRGNHPLASDSTRGSWARLHEVFKNCLHADLASAVQSMLDVAASITPPLVRCDDYLHAVLGARPDGSLVCIYANGLMEHLGRAAKDRGCDRAVCVENSGSIMPTYMPKGIAGERIPLLRSPNFRPHGRTLLVLELNQPGFESQAMI